MLHLFVDRWLFFSESGFLTKVNAKFDDKLYGGPSFENFGGSKWWSLTRSIEFSDQQSLFVIWFRDS